MCREKLNKLVIETAEAVSYNVQTSEDYLSENNIDIEEYISRGLKELNKYSYKKNSLTKSKTFFRRVVLAAKIAHELHNEWTFGSIKFQKMVYLCEHASKMNFSTNYSKQAAGPMDNKFIHAVMPEFERQGWFSVEKETKGNYKKVKFTPLEGVDGYKKYYSKYYQNVEHDIQELIDLFRKCKSKEVELIATTYSCWNEINQNNDVFSEQLIIKKVYAWHKSKKSFSEEQIIDSISWMKENGVYPIS